MSRSVRIELSNNEFDSYWTHYSSGCMPQLS